MNTVEQAIAKNPGAVLAAVSNVLTEVLEISDETEFSDKAPKLIDPEKQIEIVDGEVEIKEMAGARHSGISGRLFRKLGNFIEENNLGEVYGADTTFAIGENDRLPDISFVSINKIPESGEPEGKWKIIPDLAIEVVSPTDIYSKILKNIREYLQARVKQVWLIEPEFQTVTIYIPPMKSETLTIEDTLICEEVLPGFQLAVKEIFRQLKTS
jgi:Uma2 family endonuclease